MRADVLSLVVKKTFYKICLFQLFDTSLIQEQPEKVKSGRESCWGEQDSPGSGKNIHKMIIKTRTCTSIAILPTDRWTKLLQKRCSLIRGFFPKLWIHLSWIGAVFPKGSSFMKDPWKYRDASLLRKVKQNLICVLCM